MKTFETEKGNIPEGATHYSDETRDMHFAWRDARGRTQVPAVDLDWIMFSPIRDWQPIPQINIETPEEKEVEWVNGDEVVISSKSKSKWFVVGVSPVTETSTVCVSNTGELKSFHTNQLKKPETPQQREERERLENGQSLYELVQSLWCTVDSKYTPHPYSSPMVDDKTKEMYARLARAVDYRKEG